MLRVKPIIKWFFFYKKNILELARFENKSGKKIVFYIIEKIQL